MYFIFMKYFLTLKIPFPTNYQYMNFCCENMLIYYCRLAGVVEQCQHSFDVSIFTD